MPLWFGKKIQKVLWGQFVVVFLSTLLRKPFPKTRPMAKKLQLQRIITCKNPPVAQLLHRFQFRGAPLGNFWKEHCCVGRGDFPHSNGACTHRARLEGGDQENTVAVDRRKFGGATHCCNRFSQCVDLCMACRIAMGLCGVMPRYDYPSGIGTDGNTGAYRNLPCLFSLIHGRAYAIHHGRLQPGRTGGQGGSGRRGVLGIAADQRKQYGDEA